METIGGFSACIAIAGLATKVAKSLQNLIDDLVTAEKRLQLLRSQVRAFSISINNIVQAAQTSGATSSTLDAFSRDLLDAAAGGVDIIKELETEIIEIRSNAIRSPNGKVVSRASLMDRLEFKWNEDRINKWRAELHAQCLSLLMLIQRYVDYESRSHSYIY